MEKARIAAELANRPRPDLVLALDQYESTASCPHTIELKLDLPSKTVLHLPENYECIQESVRQVFANYSKIRTVLLREQQRSEKAEAEHTARLHQWVQEMDVAEEFSQGLFWKVEDKEPVCLSGSEAVLAQEQLSINPRFLTNPNRFDDSRVNLPKKAAFQFVHSFHTVANAEQAHIEHKRSQVWTMTEIYQFLVHYFRTPNNFKEIAKGVPEKRVQDVVQFFYLIKYEFRLKRLLRIQARKRDESLREVHADQVLQKLKKKVGTKEWVSADELARLMKPKKYESVDKYFTAFGKDKTKIRPSSPEYQDYCMFKEWAFGGDIVQDHGPVSDADTVRSGSSQWTYQEKQQFLELFKQVGRDWQFISSQISSKSPSQVRNYFQNYKAKLNLESLDPNSKARAGSS